MIRNDPERHLQAIEMSQRGGSVAFGREAGALLVERFESGGGQDADPLVPTIDRLVRAAGCAPKDIGAIGVSVGPGGFTGLRISVTVAKCLSESLGVPVVAVPSALVAAAAAEGQGDWIVALASKRETAWISRVRSDDGRLVIEGQPGVVNASDFRTDPHDRTLLADEFAPADMIARARDAGLTIERPQFDAIPCWRLAKALFQRGSMVNPLELAPLYPREPEAVTLWRERHGTA